MRFLVIFSVLSLLTACSFGMSNDSSSSSGSVSGDTVAKITPTEAKDGTLVTLNYTLREGSKDGKILETTVKDIAIENGMASTGTEYQPFQVMLGSKSVIPGFEKGLMGMKKGEKKTIEVSPEMGYGTGPTLQTVDKKEIAPVFTVEQDKKLFEKTITQTVERTQLPENMKEATLGQTLTGANGSTTAKVIKADKDTVTLEIQNVANPFYDKKVAVGVTAEDLRADATYKILKINGTGITLEVTNRASPFYNKKFAVGEKVETRQGKIGITAIDGDDVTLAIEHPLMGKTLFFDVEIIDLQ